MTWSVRINNRHIQVGLVKGKIILKKEFQGSSGKKCEVYVHQNGLWDLRIHDELFDILSEFSEDNRVINASYAIPDGDEMKEVIHLDVLVPKEGKHSFSFEKLLETLSTKYKKGIAYEITK